jgi:5-formyltetrahydrofolate cyclo-ligase
MLLTSLPPQTLAFCAPVRGEFDARPLATELLGCGWQAAMPVVVAPAAPMVFRAWSPDPRWAPTATASRSRRSGPELRPDIVLLPLVAFDAQCFRLGYGGGYFDRTLAALVPRPQAIGVGFELAASPTSGRRRTTCASTRSSPKPAFSAPAKPSRRAPGAPALHRAARGGCRSSA